MTENQIVLETLVRKDAPEYTLYSAQADYDFDYNNAARMVISTALGEIPGVVFALSVLVEIFWPDSQENVWSEIKDQVEALVD
ncbi:hypothetical protein [Methanosarcina acetivorans]|uniref:Uncharacterized protein n=1 Tax=Methanosarcina acetivorans (strain ATCC 35395 / DSM 2834 / JCM 12185 / C2A) TaxID=188937 RepID=Q8TMN3_METAC|nr:hypothetical protein [Methanosarcina acetivorans]AAM06001.1 conserved hypothetical protein [Methanosarcina acetivorans C2A]